MLVLSRRSGESIIIDGKIEVKIITLKGGTVKVGIEAPREIPVHRKEIYEAIRKANEAAAESGGSDASLPQDPGKDTDPPRGEGPAGSSGSTRKDR